MLSRENVRNALLVIGGASLLVIALKLVGLMIEFGVHFDIKFGSL